MHSLALILLVAFFVPFTHAEEIVPSGITLQRLSGITNDQNSNVNYLSMMVDQNKNAVGFYNIGDPDNEIHADESNPNELWFRDMERGVVFFRKKARNIIILKGQINSTTQEGSITVQYLANGLTGHYESCDFWVRHSGSTWYLQNAYSGAVINSVKILTWTLGVKTIAGICR